MSYIIRPASNTGDDLTGAIEFADSATLPQVLSNVPAGDWVIGKVSWQSADVVVTEPSTTTSTSTEPGGQTSTTLSSTNEVTEVS